MSEKRLVSKFQEKRKHCRTIECAKNEPILNDKLEYTFRTRNIKSLIFLKINSKLNGKFKIRICGTFNLINECTRRDNSSKPIKN